MNAPAVMPHHVQQWLKDGADHDAVVRVLVASGAWTQDGAKEIVSTLSADGLAPNLPKDLGWPGPLEEVPPLFTA